VTVAVLPGDGIGREVTAEAVGLASELASRGVADLELVEFDWGAERFLATGVAVPPGGFDELRTFDAILVGAFGDPRVSGHEHAREILLGLRSELDLYVNLRPIRCAGPKLNPLRKVDWKEIDLVVVRENTEGLYCGAGGVAHRGGPDAVAVEEMIVTARGTRRVIEAAFALAERRRRRHVTLVDKSNALQHAGEIWRRAFADVAREHPQVATGHLYVDTAALTMVENPGSFDVLVTDNLFGDILSEVGAALQGGLGVAASANLGSGRTAAFEPVHGSAPALAGSGRANPLAAFAAFALLLRHVSHDEVAGALEDAVAEVARTGPHTPDLGGRSSTAEVGEAVRRAVLARAAA